jgi:hypothetical protein
MSRALQIAGMIAVTAGVIWLSVPAGLIVAGVFLLLTGIATAE